MITGLKKVACAVLLAGAVLAALLPGGAALAQSPPTNIPATAADAPVKQMRFRVLDAETSQPVPGVKVRAWVGTNLVTDETGGCSIAMPRAASGNFSYRITITKDGYVAKYIVWAKARQDKYEDIPAEYTAKMEKAATIGGVLQSDDGQPLARARILFSGEDTAAATDREKTTLAPNYHVEITDENGHWQFTQAPQHFEDMTLRVIHQDFAATTFGCVGSVVGGEEVVRLAAADFRAGKAVLVMSHGLVLSGIVLDNAGKPVPGATITRNHEWRNRAAVLQSDEQGRFKISNLQPGDLVLTIQAKGLEAQTLTLAAAKPMPEFKVEMNPGKILKGRVLDNTGKPVAGVGVQMDREGLHPLEFDWNSYTDSDGHFLWDGAPSGPHPYLFTADGFNLRSEPALEADGVEKIITLHKSSTNMVIDGRVTDAASHEPIGKFTVLLRVSRPNGLTNLAKEVTNSSGDYSVEVDQNATAFTLEFRAPGYLPARTETKSPGDGDQRVDIQLEKGSALAGVILLPNGSPVLGADVALCTETEGAEIGGRHIKGIYQTNITTTSTDGSFIFPNLAGGHTIYAANEQGFAQLDITEVAPPFKITLAPWGAIEGTAMLAGKPLAGAAVALQGPLPNPSAAGLAISPIDYTATTDAQGKFVFSNLPPIDLRLGRLINGFFHNAEYVTVKPGAPTVLQYGGVGAVVAGRLQVPGYAHPIHWQAGQSIVLVSDVPEPKSPAFDNAEGEKVWVSQFWKSDEGKTWQRAQRAFTTTAEDDGSFKIEDVPPGKYKLRVQLREAAEFGGQRLATLETNFTVAGDTNTATETKMDLGLVDVPPAANLRPGDMAPLFETKTIFGHPLKLADYRGKYVLVDFWATWCGPCVAEMPNLKAVFDKFGKDPHFAMMSLSLDALQAQPIEFIHENDIRWIQGFLGNWSESPVPELYGVDGIPAIFLIGPDGKIVARDLRGEGISAAISKALLGAD